MYRANRREANKERFEEILQGVLKEIQTRKGFGQSEIAK